MNEQLTPEEIKELKSHMRPKTAKLLEDMDDETYKEIAQEVITMYKHLLSSQTDDKLREEMRGILLSFSEALLTECKITETTDQISVLFASRLLNARKEEREKALKAMEIFDGQNKPNPYTILRQALSGELPPVEREKK